VGLRALNRDSIPPAPFRANALKISEDFPPQKGAKKRKKRGFSSQVARILVQRIKRRLKETVTFL